MIARRTLLAGAALMGAVGLLPLRAGAAEALPYDAKGDPFEFIVKLNNAVLDRIRADKALRHGDIAALTELVNSLIMPAVDFQMMTRMTVGPKWRQASADQKQALMDGFELLLMRVYAGALAEVSDQTVKLRPSRSRKVQEEMVIRTLMTSGSGQETGIDYRIYRSKTGEWKIVDVNIEGIWMVENYRSQFASVLSEGGIDGLIKLFKEKGESLADQMKTTSPGAKK